MKIGLWFLLGVLLFLSGLSLIVSGASINFSASTALGVTVFVFGGFALLVFGVLAFVRGLKEVQK